MQTRTQIMIPFILVAIAACGQSEISSRSVTPAMSFATAPAKMDAQAVALTELSERIVVQTSLKGAGIGAAVGCGIAAVSAGNVRGCITAAATGALGGAVIGNISGKRDVARRIELISPSAVVRTLRKTNDQMTVVASSLPARLAEQDETLAQLELHRATGVIDAVTYREGRAAIMAERQAMADALIQTQSHADQATANLLAASAEGQTGLDWHISATRKLARDAGSARAAISLL